MKNFIDKYWMLSIPLVLIIFILAGQCSTKHTEKVITDSELSMALAKQKNELETKYISMLSDSSKVIQANNKRISDGLKPIIIYKEKKAKALVDKVRKDTATTALCDSAINAQEQLIFDLQTKAYHDSIQLAECNKQNAYKDLTILKKDTTIVEAERVNANLTKELERNNNWFNRSKIWIGAVAGSVVTLLLLK